MLVAAGRYTLAFDITFVEAQIYISICAFVVKYKVLYY